MSFSWIDMCASARQLCSETLVLYDECRKKGGTDNKCIKKVCSKTGDCYVIKKGDTYSKIADRHGLTVSTLLQYNPEIKDKSKIHVDDVILLISAVEFMCKNNRCHILYRYQPHIPKIK